MERGLAKTRIEALVQRLDAGLQLARSLDGMLIVLESELLVIREEAERAGVDPARVLSEALSSPRITPYLERLKCCEGEMFALLENPRFKGLRRYREVLEQVLSRVECRGDGLIDCGVPQPAWAKERAPVGRNAGKEPSPREAHVVPVRVVRRSRIPLSTRGFGKRLSRGDLLAYGFLALLALLNAIILLTR